MVVRWWKDLPVAKKLYSVVGLMALLIATELIALIFAMNTLSSLRAFVAGEGLWTKSQKDAIHSLYQYALLGDDRSYETFRRNLEIPEGDRLARIELKKPSPNLEIVRQGFLTGKNHPDDIDRMIKLLTRFHENEYLKVAISAWEQADAALDQIIILSDELRQAVQAHGLHSPELQPILENIAQANTKLTHLEITFSSSLGAGSRWMENLLMIVLTLTILTVEGIGLLLTFLFSRNLSRSLTELKFAATEVGQGIFSRKVVARSGDELGQLTHALNQMIENLEANIAERKQTEEALRKSEFEKNLAHIRLQKLNEDLENRVIKRTEELSEARDAANIANATKSEFLANMSHEIRTPLGAILGFSEILLSDDMTTAERTTGVEVIKRNGQLLSNVINDILDLSKVEAGKLAIEIMDLAFEGFLHEIETLLSLKASEKGVTLTIETAGIEIPKVIKTDPLRLRQVLVNIGGNAIKFTSSGGSVHIQAQLQRTSENRYQLAFSVKDTGTGISDDQVSKLFAPFSQADASTTRKFGGTGLGLVLSKKLSQALGGDVILAESRPGQGSTFIVTIDPGPIAPTIQHRIDLSELERQKTRRVSEEVSAPPLQQNSVQFPGLRILIVDDSYDNQLIATHFLKRTGATIDTANNGKEAVDLVAQRTYDLIFMDLQMPVMDGYEALKELRQSGFQKPVIALTAHAMKEERTRCFESGFNEHLSKPVERQKMLAVITHFIKDQRPPTSPS